MGSYLKEYNLLKDSCISESPPEHGGYLWKGEKQRLTAPLKTVQLYSVCISAGSNLFQVTPLVSSKQQGYLPWFLPCLGI